MAYTPSIPSLEMGIGLRLQALVQIMAALLCVCATRAFADTTASAWAPQTATPLRLNARWFYERDGVYAIDPVRCFVPQSTAERARLLAELARLFAAAIRNDSHARALPSWLPALALLDRIAAASPVALRFEPISRKERTHHDREQASESITASDGIFFGSHVNITCVHACCGWPGSCGMSATLPNGNIVGGEIETFGSVEVTLGHCSEPSAPGSASCEDRAPPIRASMPAPPSR